MLASEINEKNINEFGRFDDLENTIDKKKAKEYLEGKKGKKMPPFKITRDASKMLRDFVLTGGFDIYEDKAEEYDYAEEKLGDGHILGSNMVAEERK